MAFDSQTIEMVWRKARIVGGYDPNTWRADDCGNWILRSSYGTTSKYGWEIDHSFPSSLGGSDRFSNLRPLHWQNNRAKGNGPLFPQVEIEGGAAMRGEEAPRKAPFRA